MHEVLEQQNKMFDLKNMILLLNNLVGFPSNKSILAWITYPQKYPMMNFSQASYTVSSKVTKLVLYNIMPNINSLGLYKKMLPSKVESFNLVKLVRTRTK